MKIRQRVYFHSRGNRSSRTPREFALLWSASGPFRASPKTSPISRNVLISQRYEKPNPSHHNHQFVGGKGHHQRAWPPLSGHLTPLLRGRCAEQPPRIYTRTGQTNQRRRLCLAVPRFQGQSPLQNHFTSQEQVQRGVNRASRLPMTVTA
jgi:hypothetical protein